MAFAYNYHRHIRPQKINTSKYHRLPIFLPRNVYSNENQVPLKYFLSILHSISSFACIAVLHYCNIEFQARPIVVSERTGMPVGVLPEKGLSLKQIEREMNAKNRADRACTYRPGDETTEERKARKQAVKEERKVRFMNEKIRDRFRLLHYL